MPWSAAMPAETVTGPACSSDGDEALGHAAGARQRGAGHDHGQLVGAGAPDDVAAADQLAQPRADRGEGLVAGGGAAAPVQRPEAVDVDEDERGGLTAALGPAQGRGGGLAEGVVRQDPGALVAAQVLDPLGFQRGDPRLGDAQLVAEATALGEDVSCSRHASRIGVHRPQVACGAARVDAWPSRLWGWGGEASGPARRMPWS